MRTRPQIEKMNIQFSLPDPLTTPRPDMIIAVTPQNANKQKHVNLRE